MEELGSIEDEWNEKILDYIAEHYPTQAVVSAKTNSEQGLREREAMKNDEALKQLRAEAKAAIDRADAEATEAYMREESENDNEEVRMRRGDMGRNLPQQATEEESIEREAKANGTWLKAPNGQPTKLTPRQWVQVRTQAFKNWFGDWEKVARIEKLRGSKPVEVSGNDYEGKYELNPQSATRYILDELRGEYLNKDTGETIRISRKGAEKVMKHDVESEAHLKSAAYIPFLIENATFITEERNEKDKTGFDSYRYYVTGMKMGGVDYTVKLVVGIRDGQAYYDHALTEIEKNSLIESIDPINTGFANNEAVSAVKDKRLLSILQTDASKVVDENGEPLVVYHGARRSGFSVFDDTEGEKKSDAPEGTAWFSPNSEVARSYSGTYDKASYELDEEEEYGEPGNYACFLNLRNPYYENFGGANWDGSTSGKYQIEANTEDGSFDYVVDKDDGTSFFDSREDAERYAEEQGLENYEIREDPWFGTSTNEVAKNAREWDYDGAVIENVVDNGGFTDVDASTVFVAFSPNQIKSATDNVGTFDAGNEDIRFRMAEPTEQQGELVAVHNLSEDKLKEALDLGGFPMPSIAITKGDMGHTEFGDISLVFGRESIDPADRQNKVYGEDAWTPTFPQIGIKIDDNVLERIENRVRLLVGDALFDELKNVIFYPTNVETGIDGRSGRVDYGMAAEPLFKLAYLKDAHPETTIQGADTKEIREKVNGLVDSNNTEYRKWLDTLFDGIVEKRGIRNTKDMLTPMGNRRSFEALYDEITLDNVVKSMKRHAAKGGEGIFNSSIFGAAQKDFKSIEQIRKAARERIRQMNQEEYDRGREVIKDRLSKIVVPGMGEKVSDVFDWIGNVIDAVAKSHAPQGIYNYLKGFYPGMTMEAAKEIADVVKDIQKMSARYFEAKPRRAVGIREVKFAIVPEGTDAEIIKRLERYGIPVKTYEKGNEARRVQLVNEESAKAGIRFRFAGEMFDDEGNPIRHRFIGEKGAANLDRSEEATTRLDNLAVAREMEAAEKDAKAIKMATGWERGADGKWRYETEDNLEGVRFKTQEELIEEYRSAKKEADKAQAKWLNFSDHNPALHYRASKENSPEENGRLKKERTAAQKKERELFSEYERLGDMARKLERRVNDGVEGIPLAEVIGEDNPLLQAYPEMRDISVSFYVSGRYIDSRGANGFYQKERNSIFINTDMTHEKMRSTLAHELQHAVQDIEGFARGGHPSEFKGTMEDVVGDIVRATNGKALDGGSIDITPQGIFSALDRETAYGSTILRDYGSALDKVAEKYGYETVFDLVNNIDKFKSSRQQYRSLAGEVESRNVQARMDMTPEERRASLASETEDVAREEQIFLNDALGTSAAAEEKPVPSPASVSDRAKRQAVEALSKRIGVPVVIEDRTTPKGRSRRFGAQKAWFVLPNAKNPNGAVHVNVDNHASVEDVERSIAHEVVAHLGMRKLMGEEKYNALLDKVHASMTEEQRAYFEAYAAQEFSRREGMTEAEYRAELRRVAADEYIASLAEVGTDPTTWQKVVALVREALRALGFNLSMSDADIRALLYESRHNLESAAYYAEREMYRQRQEEFRAAAELDRRIREDEGESTEDTNERFNEQLESLTEENANSKILSLGNPSGVLLAAGVADKPMRLYGNKVMAKVRKHGYP
ncbi:MAG: hypothetical protein NC324_09760, partial [Bacteroides sp.]|nr:hypothetical protein [Bacteroides sp.]